MIGLRHSYIYSIFSPGYHFSRLYYSPSFLLLFPPLFLFCCTRTQLHNPGWAEILASVSWVFRRAPLRSLHYLSILVYHWRSWIFWSFYTLSTLLQDATLCTDVPACFVASRTHLLVGLLSSLRKDPPERKALDLIRICLCFFGTKDSVHIAIS